MVFRNVMSYGLVNRYYQVTRRHIWEGCNLDTFPDLKLLCMTSGHMWPILNLTSVSSSNAVIRGWDRSLYCVCVCVCVWERERERARASEGERESARVWECALHFGFWNSMSIFRKLLMARGAQTPLARTLGGLHFIRWLLIFVGPECGTCFI